VGGGGGGGGRPPPPHASTRVTTAIVFKRNEDSFYYVGKGGSLRVGSRRDASMPVRQTRIDEIVSAGNLALAAGERAATEAVAPVQAARRQRNILRRRFQ
jgi:hypothetical protein